jgi:uncharacterized protein YbjT (DUF2867 family)
MAKQRTKIILVTGATGHQGGASLHHLRKRGFAVRALTRDPDKSAARSLTGAGTEIIRGDLDDSSVLGRALEDVQGVYSVQDSTHGFESEVRQGRSLADIANRLRINHFVYSSVASADQKTGIPHFESKAQVETHLRNTGLRFTIFRPVFFMENLLSMQSAVEHGALQMPLQPTTRLQMVSVDDIGAFVAMAFEHPGHWENRTMELAGDEMSMLEIAAALSRVAGRPVQYSQTPWNVFEEKAGKELSTMFRWFDREGYHVDIPAVRQERPQLMTFDRWLDLNWSKSGSSHRESAA